MKSIKSLMVGAAALLAMAVAQAPAYAQGKQQSPQANAGKNRLASSKVTGDRILLQKIPASCRGIVASKDPRCNLRPAPSTGSTGKDIPASCRGIVASKDPRCNLGAGSSPLTPAALQ